MDGSRNHHPSPPPVGFTMSVYERLQEEREDAKKKKTKAKARRQLTSFQIIKEAAQRKKHHAWRYYRATARIRKRIQRELEDASKAKTDLDGHNRK